MIHDDISIHPCTHGDTDSILRLYEFARALQQEKKMVVWPGFSRGFLEQEISENRQWKLLVNGELACNWAITWQDKEIWEGRDDDPAIYIHRICTHADYRGRRFIDSIVGWAKEYARATNKKFIRLDTLGNNTRLIEHYTSAGFSFLGMYRLKHTAALPQHYQDQPDCCLFEIPIK